MTTDLLFAPALPRNLPSSVQSDRVETLTTSPASKTNTPESSTDNEPDTFLTTLNRVAQDQNPTSDSQQPKSTGEVHSAEDELPLTIDLIADEHSSGEEILTELLSFLQVDESSPTDQPPVSTELSELISLLEAMGWAGDSGEPTAKDGGGLNMDTLPRSDDSHQSMPSHGKAGNGIPVVLEQLQNLIAGKLPTESAMPNVAEAPGGLNRKQSEVSVELIRWAKGVLQGQGQSGPTNAAAAGEGQGTEKPVAQVFAAKDPAMVESGGQVQRSSMSENPERVDVTRPNPEIRVSADVDGPARNIKVSDSLQGNGPANSDAHEMAAKAAGGRRSAGGPSMMTASSGQPAGGEPLQEDTPKGDTPPVTKTVDDPTAGKDNSLKVDPALNGDAGTRVVKAEGSTHDGGQWTSQAHSSEKAVETASSTREAQGTPRELQTHTMEQIVRRAVFQVKDGQQEARIDLKPDFLGHVRMQVITENQQVTVKILTEFGFVKDMLENNIQQLKADLQQQGLEVDKLDVSVSRDSNGKNHQQENMEQAKNQSSEKQARNDDENDAEGQPDKGDRTTGKADGRSTVDYFA